MRYCAACDHQYSGTHSASKTNPNADSEGSFTQALRMNPIIVRQNRTGVSG